jgi:LPXTG-motif cell wall-anchored protein
MLMTIGFARSAAAVAVDEFNIFIPIDTVVFAPEGSTTVLATVPVGEEFAGQVCSVATRAENQESVHPGNDLIVESGSSLVTLEDVEGTAGGVVVGEGELELGSEIVVSLIMGRDEVFSAGFELGVVCALSEETTTTTTTIAATTTTMNGEVGSTSVTLPPEETTSTVEDSVGGTVITTTTVGDEVEDLEVLPFTGSHDAAWLFLLGSALALAGILVVGSKREDTE